MDQIDDPQQPYEWWTGGTTFEITSPKHSRKLVDGLYYEQISVVWNEFLGRWLMVGAGVVSRDIEIRVAMEPWGPWSEAKTVYTKPGFKWQGITKYVTWHPEMFESSGRVVYASFHVLNDKLPYLLRLDLSWDDSIR